MTNIKLTYKYTLDSIKVVNKGLAPNVGGKIILPKQLISKEWNEAAEDDYLYSLVEYLEQETLLVLNKLRDYQSTRLARAITSVAIAVILFGLDEILGSSLPVFGNYC